MDISTMKILNSLLPQIAKENDLIKHKARIGLVPRGKEHSTTLYDIQISDDDGYGLHLFAKVASTEDQKRSPSPKIYLNEIFAYTKLRKVYRNLENERDVLKRNRLSIPQFYGYNPAAYEETIVLENLLSSDYLPFNIFESIDWEYAKAALTQLTQMHALAFAYGEKYPEEFAQVLENHSYDWSDIGSMGLYFKRQVDKAIEVTHAENKEKLKKYYENFEMDSFIDYYSRCRRKVLGHGEFRPMNLMQKRRDDGTVKIKIVDLQTLNSTSPVIDLLYFLFMGADEEFRAQHYDNAIEHYLKELHASMKGLGLSPEKVYSKDDFDYELKEKLPYGLAIAVLGLQDVIMADDDVPRVSIGVNRDPNSLKSTSELYAEKMNGVVNDFVKWGILK